MEIRVDHFESAKTHLFDTSSCGPFCDVTLTLKHARQPDNSGWVKIDELARTRQVARIPKGVLSFRPYWPTYDDYLPRS